MTTLLYLHAFQLHRGPVFRSLAWLGLKCTKPTPLPPQPATGQLNLFGETAQTTASCDLRPLVYVEAKPR